MKKINLLLALGVFSMLFITSCEKDEPEDPIIPNEEEVITTLNFTLTPDGGGTPVVLSFQDLDGDGGNAPTISEGILDNNTIYNGSLELLNELEDPAEDITLEVAEEELEHQFFYETLFPTELSDVNIAYNDLDEEGNPIGLSTVLTTGEMGSGTITVTLRHEPNKDAEGVSSGDIANAGGETDIEVTFNVEIQ
ncbi:MAG: type 1 periplasmic binding fold superfamily protein [Flavobacteriales bacterium]